MAVKGYRDIKLKTVPKSVLHVRKLVVVFIKPIVFCFLPLLLLNLPDLTNCFT